jgi:hypothetical protein
MLSARIERPNGDSFVSSDELLWGSLIFLRCTGNDLEKAAPRWLGKLYGRFQYFKEGPDLFEFWKRFSGKFF